MSQQRIFLAIAGNIGTGKTTLTEMLSKRFGWEPHFEVVRDNPYLEDFYKDMGRWSFPLQVFFLHHRFNSHRLVQSAPNSAIQDRSIYEDANIFARNLHTQGLMSERDYQNYLSLYQSLIETLTPPDLIVYLRKPLPKLIEQIKKRGRNFEQNIPEDYLNELSRYYDDWMAHYSLGKKLILDTGELDFVNNRADFDGICESILKALDQRDLYLESQILGLRVGR